MIDLKDKVQNIEFTLGKSDVSRASPSPRYVSKDLFSASNEIRIDYNGAVYTLRITRSGGLLLNK